MSKSDHKHSSYGGKSVFSRRGSRSSQGPGLLGYGFKIPYRTIRVKIPMEHRAKFQLSSGAAKKLIDRQTDRRTDRQTDRRTDGQTDRCNMMFLYCRKIFFMTELYFLWWKFIFSGSEI
jgi:hypothetical protein